jgi:glutathione S-transferase
MSNLTIIGTPFSTFTRTIALGLNRKGIAYDQIATAPHSNIAETHHPMGYLPTLIIRTSAGGKGDNVVELRESAAIVRYIDRIAPEPSLHLKANDAILEEKMWEFVSIISSYGESI